MQVLKKEDNMEGGKGAYKEEINLENKTTLIDLLINTNNRFKKKLRKIQIMNIIDFIIFI